MKIWLSKAFFFLSGLFCLAFTQYQPLKDKTFQKISGETYIEEYYIKYSIYDGNVDYDNNWIIQNLITESLKIVRYIKNEYSEANDCRFLDDLEIYSIDMDTLNDRNRFTEYSYPGIIWALFDLRIRENRKASIMLTNHQSYNSTLFKHELAHYWYFRLCLDLTDMQPEDFAEKIERF